MAAPFWYNEGLRVIAEKELDLSTGTSDVIKSALLDASTTYDTDDTHTLLNSGTLGRYTGTTDFTHTVTGAINAASDQWELDLDDALFTSVATSTTVEGTLVYWFKTNDTDSVPLFYFGTPLTPNGNNITIQWGALVATITTAGA